MSVNTAALKTFAPAMRRQLLEAVGRKLDLLLTRQTPDTLSTHTKQISELREQEAQNRDQVLERVAYSWFNRLAALRYLDARGWHPFGAKVLMPQTESETQPEVLKLLRSGSLPAELQPHCNETRLQCLLDGRIPTAQADADPQGEVYRELILAVCRSYHQLLPNLFEGLDDASELLLPDDLLSDGSIAGGFRSQISDGDCQDVEVIGWLYQFYISEKKDQVIGKVVKSEDIPAATQLFTPNWIVKYMVQNSLGAQWLATYPDSAIKKQMEYYIEPAEQSEEVKAQLAAITPDSLNPEELTLIDPACGSGHILVEAYELFKAIYLERGYQQREIPQLILEKNLFGLEICPRAAQLTSFALIMKGRADDRRLFDRGVKLNVMALVDSTEFDAVGLANAVELADYGLKLSDLSELKRLFEHATTFGSLIQVPEGLAEKLSAINRSSEISSENMIVLEALKQLGPLVRQAKLLAAQYDAVVANPPYIGGKFHTPTIKHFLKENYAGSEKDLFAAFVVRNVNLCSPCGRMGFMTPQVWMFLTSYERLRAIILGQTTITTLVHPEYNAFWDSAHVALCSFTLQKCRLIGHDGLFIRLAGFYGAELQPRKTLEAIGNPNCGWLHRACADAFRRIAGSPVAYWLPETALSALDKTSRLGTLTTPRKGMCTRDNDYFVRSWGEVSFARIGLGQTSRDEASATGMKWFPYQKGGNFRQWYGNHDWVVNWENDGYALLNMESLGWRGGSTNHNIDYIFRPAVVWSKITSSIPNFRASPYGFLYDDASGLCSIDDETNSQPVLGFLCSKVGQFYMGVINPTVNIQPGNMASMPFLRPSCLADIDSIISTSRTDWDAYERSWDFQSLPLLTASSDPTPSLEASYTAWIAKNKETIAEIKRLEEENNRLFIDAYGLQDELTPDVPIEQITLTVNPAYRYGGKLTEEELWSRFRSDTMEELLSYGVGCMMGRYSLDHPGLILANAGDTLENYFAKVCKDCGDLTFQPDPDGILPVLDGEWFEDDIVARTREFLAVTFPESSVAENLRFIEESLGKDIRKYFCTDFYKDHLQTYKKRPIYWLVQSPAGPAKGGFACLFYLHRYTKDTLNQVLNNYFRPYLQKLEARLAQLGLDQLNDDLPARERTAARKEAEKITKVLKECQAWEQDALLPLAQQRIELDLDDGVKVNYLKLQDVLAPIPGLAAKED